MLQQGRSTLAQPELLLQGRAPEAGGGEDTLLRSVMGLRAKLPDAAGLGGVGSPATGAESASGSAQPALPPAQMVHTWSAVDPVIGIAWLAARRLAVISGTSTAATLRLYSGPGTWPTLRAAGFALVVGHPVLHCSVFARRSTAARSNAMQAGSMQYGSSV